MPRALTRFELAVVVRVQVSDLAVLRHYLAVEAAMEELADAIDLDRDLAAMTGFGAAIDAQLCAHNPDRRGEVAAEMLRTEGADPAVIDAVVAARKQPADALEPLAAALLVADALVAAALSLALEDDGEDGDPLDELSPRGIAVAVALAARRAPEGDAARALAAVAALGMDMDRAAALTLQAVRRVRADLGL